MTDQKIINHWLYAFARDVDKSFIDSHVISVGNFLWHIFSYEKVECLREDEARKVFDSMEYDRAIRFHDGFGGRISEVCETGKILSGALDQEHKRNTRDVYIVASDFSWTYVKTHENGWCGPYFCYRKADVWECSDSFIPSVEPNMK